RAPTAFRRSTSCARGSRTGERVRSQASDPHVDMCRILRPVMQQLGDEVAHVETEHLALPHRHVAARGGVEVAVVKEADLADRIQAAAQVRVLAVEFDGGVEAADARERLAANSEIAPVE